MKSLFSLAILCWMSVLCARSVSGQVMFLDSNGDGEWTVADRVEGNSETRFDLWVVTDRNGTAEHGLAGEGRSINSYQVILAATGGAVRWGEYVNLQPSMYLSAGRHESNTEIFLGYLGMEQLPPGRYKLGSMTVTPVEGFPSLRFRSKSTVYEPGFTAFGSRYPGKDFDSTLKYTETEQGDWNSARGLGNSNSSPDDVEGSPAEFRVLVRRSTEGLAQAHVMVTTIRPGPVSLRLFNVRGQLIQTLRGVSQYGKPLFFDVGQGGGLAAGIYAYRVDAIDGTKSGKLAILR